jgi:TetR/AcrR family transcriptional repressor of nem operon
MSAESSKTQKRNRLRPSGERLRKPGAPPFTLPELRARETRRRIIQAAERVFTRRGYGETVVDDILAAAGISRGAFYHHFSGKEELFKALLEEHLNEGLRAFGALGPASSLREVIERFVSFLIDDMKAHLDSEGLPFEFLAQATREDWARGPLSDFHRRTHALVVRLLRYGQEAGAVRSDLDVEAAAWLLLAVSEGLCTFKAVDAHAFDLNVLGRTWADMIENFIQSANGFEGALFEAGTDVLMEQPFSREFDEGGTPQ